MRRVARRIALGLHQVTGEESNYVQFYGSPASKFQASNATLGSSCLWFISLQRLLSRIILSHLIWLLILILLRALLEYSANLPILNLSHHAYKLRHSLSHSSVVTSNLTSPSLPLNKIVISADLAPDMSVGINSGWAHHRTHTKPLIFDMSRFDDWILLMQALIDANKA